MSANILFSEKTLNNEYRDQIEAKFMNGMADLVSKLHPPIERSKPISLDEFKTKFMDKNKPVVFEGLLHNWKAMKLWSSQR